MLGVPCSSGSGGAGAADRSLAALAEELFEETVFKAACSKGVSMRLQRTKDGATQESRIHELAGEACQGTLSTQACIRQPSTSQV
jgi:hypothetical protein